jgi:hypothetical protein
MGLKKDCILGGDHVMLRLCCKEGFKFTAMSLFGSFLKGLGGVVRYFELLTDLNVEI